MRLAALMVGLGLVACDDRSLVEEGWPCSDSRPCADGYVCSSATGAGVCVEGGGGAGGSGGADGGGAVPTSLTVAQRLSVPGLVSVPHGLVWDGSDLWVGDRATNTLYTLEGGKSVALPEGKPIVDVTMLGADVLALVDNTGNTEVHDLTGAAGSAVAEEADGLVWDGADLLVSKLGTKGELVRYDAQLALKGFLEVPTELSGCVGPLTHGGEGGYLMLWCGVEGVPPNVTMTVGLAKRGTLVTFEGYVQATIKATEVAGMTTDGDKVWLLGGGQGDDAGVIVEAVLE